MPMSSTAVPVLSFARPVSPPRLVSFDAEPQRAEIDLSRTALLVVDMQNDFLHPDGWFPRLGFDPAPLAKVIPKLTELTGAARGAGVQVIWLNWGVRPDRAELSAPILNKMSAGGTRPVYADPSVPGRGRILVTGDWGAQLVDELKAEPSDLIIHKHRLSGFHDNELDSVLRNRGIDTLLFSGTNTDRCVFSTLCDASFLGYGCLMVTDACATGSPAYVTDAIHYLVRLLYGVTLRSDDLMDAFASAGR